MPNVTQYFHPARGRWKLQHLPMIASVAMSMGGLVYAAKDGTHTKSTASTGNAKGILAQTIAATDADYATSMKKKAVWIPLDATAEAYCAIGAGTFTTAMVGGNYKLNDYLGVDVGTTGTQIEITKYISSTRAMCRINRVIS